MKAKSIKGNFSEEIQSALQQAMSNARPDDPFGRGFKSTWAGFYPCEFGRAVNGKHEFHSTTSSWVALKEKGV